MKFTFKKEACSGGATAPKPSPEAFIFEVGNDGGAVHTIETSPKATSSPKSTAAASSIGSSRFGFSSPFKKTSSFPPSSSVAHTIETSPKTDRSPKCTSAASSIGSSRFGFSSPFKKTSSFPSSSSVAPTSTSHSRSSKKSKGSSKKSKKTPPQWSDDDGDYNESRSRKKSSKSSSSSSLCCCSSCSNVATYGIFLILGTIIGVMTWRYGPWAKDSATTVSLEAVSSSCEDCCNGLASNCDLALDQVVFPMVRKAHSSYANNFVGASNSKPFEQALVAGYRALQLSTCMCESLLSAALLERNETWGLKDSNLGFCDSVCAAGVRDPTDVLSNLRAFIETNPREVLIVEFDMGVASSPDLRTALVHSGLLDYVFIPQFEYAIEWPTLGEMIELDKRLVLFGVGDGMSSCPANRCKDGILNFADHVAVTSDGYGADLTTCEPTSTGEILFSLFQVNHYDEPNRQIPSSKRAGQLNSYANLAARMKNCRGAGYRPWTIAVNFWDQGDLLKFVQDVNSGNISDGGGGGGGGEGERGLRGFGVSFQ